VRLEQIYQQVILDHYKHPHHRGLREPFGGQVHHVNPTCGDEVTLRVALTADGSHVADISYDGQGCSISQAATSVLTDQVIGQSVDEALDTVAAFTEMISSRGQVEGDEDVLGDGIAFAGVAKYPARVKCALLGWTAFKAALAEASASQGGLAPASTDSTVLAPASTDSTVLAPASTDSTVLAPASTDSREAGDERNGHSFSG
jgi:nitrogen fixation NifU-like protein